MLVIWLVCRKLFVGRNPDIVYVMLRWVVAMFLLPVAFTATLFSYRRSYIIENDGMLKSFVFPVSLNLKYVYLVALVWLAATLFNVVKFGRIAWYRYDLCRGNIPEDDSQAMKVFEDVKKELGIRGKVELVRNDLLTSPIVTGVFRPRVILPYLKYGQDELKVILTHELLHIKKHDLYYKALSIFIVVIQSFNPPAYFLIRLLDLWSEQDCDRKVMERLGSDEFTFHEYFDLIWKFGDKDDWKKRNLYSFSMLGESADNLERRVEFMDKYGKKVNKTPGIAIATLLAAFVFVSTSVSYAAGIKVAQANDTAFKTAQKVEIVDAAELKNGSEQFEVSAEENALVTEVCMESDIMTISGGAINWTIPVGQRYVTAEKWLSKGTEVTITVSVTPTTCKYWFGLMESDGDSVVCAATGAASSTFTVSYSGFYRIMVENRSSSEITAVGAYSY